MMDEKEIINNLVKTFSHKELAGMYALCNKREQDLIVENNRLLQKLKDQKQAYLDLSDVKNRIIEGLKNVK